MHVLEHKKYSNTYMFYTLKFKHAIKYMLSQIRLVKKIFALNFYYVQF